MSKVLIDDQQKPYWGEDEGYIAIKFASQSNRKYYNVAPTQEEDK